eukprot:626893-Pelagomonas_calceolata.AAC.1
MTVEQGSCACTLLQAFSAFLHPQERKKRKENYVSTGFDANEEQQAWYHKRLLPNVHDTRRNKHATHAFMPGAALFHARGSTLSILAQLLKARAAQL